MSQSDKAAFYRALKDAGVTFDKHYRDYNTEELQQAYLRLIEERPELAASPAEQPAPAPAPAAQPTLPPLRAPRTGPNPDEMPGQRLNTKDEDEPIRVDEDGLIWFQEEVRKPGYAKPRGRRVLKYLESGVKTETVQNGDYVETFEVAGSGAKIPAEVKITLPSYQVGIYRDPRMPFKIHLYNEVRGFDFFEVNEFYGGPELVPASVKRIYVENVLCYDIRTTVQAIQAEYRQLTLAGKVN